MNLQPYFRGSFARLPIAALLIALGAAALPAQPELRATGRKVAQDFGDSIVTVKAIISVQATLGGNQSPEEEYKGETSGTVVAPDGTTVIPLSEIDPTNVFKRMMSPDRAAQISIDSRVKDLKIVLKGQRKEVDATVVQRDPDLDLAVIRPVVKPDVPMKAIDLDNSVEPQLLEQVFVMARMGRVADYEIGVMTGEIQSIVSKPRTFYIPSAELASGGFGVPIFNADSKLIGLVLNRIAPGGISESSIGMGNSDGGMVAIILPAADIKEIVAQARPAE
jgi:hypothetical protein